MWKPVGGFRHGHSPRTSTEVLPCGRLVHAASHAGNPRTSEQSDVAP